MKRFACAGRYVLAMSRTGSAVAGVALVVGACTSASSGSGRPNQAPMAQVPTADAATDAPTSAADTATPDAPVVVCASANDCYLKGPGTVYCCLDKVCAFSNDVTPIVDCTDAGAQLIEASNYDQSCTTDSDCVAVSVGNACYPGFLNCSMGTINVSALAHYNADVAQTNTTLCGVTGDYACGVTIACCRGDTCQTGDHCSFVSPGDAATDAEGGTGSSDTGTSDAPAGG